MDGFSMSMTILASLGVLVMLYRTNRQLAHATSEANPAWHFTGKVNALGKYLTVAGGMAILPAAAILLIAPDATGFQWLAILGFVGVGVLSMAALAMLTVLVWRVWLSPLSFSTLAHSLFQTAYRLCRCHWKKIAVAGLGLTLILWLLPVLSVIFQLGFFWFILRSRGNGYDNDDDYGICGDYNYMTGKYDSGLDPGGLYDE